MSFFSDIMDVLAGIMTVFLNYCYDFTHMIGFPSYGIAIILLTIVIKAVLAPLTAKQIRSMERMQKVQPKVKELQQKYKGNSQKMNAALQKLYKEEKVNPLAGCLPLIIQMPFLISIFYALRAYHYDPTYESFLCMPILSAISTFAIQKQMSGTQISMNEAQAKQQKIMSIVMPLFIGWISLSFPSGLVIYWVVSNVFQWVQQFVMFRMGREKGAQA